MSDKLLKGILDELQKLNRTSQDVWDMSDIASYMKFDEDHIRRRVITIPGFPFPAQLPTSEKGGHKRWFATEIKEWFKRWKIKK